MIMYIRRARLIGAVAAIVLCAVAYHRVRRTQPLIFEGSAYGGWWYDSSLLGSNPIVYSFGLGEDTSWDESLLARGAKVYGFDPTPKSVAFVNKREQLHSSSGRFQHTSKGLARNKGTVKFSLPKDPHHVSMRQGVHDGLGGTMDVEVETLRDFMRYFGHTHLDILKIDIETAEYDVLEQLIEESYMPFSQLLVEFHDNDAGMNKRRYRQILEGLKRNGFVIVKNISDKELTFMKVV